MDSDPSGGLRDQPASAGPVARLALSLGLALSIKASLLRSFRPR